MEKVTGKCLKCNGINSDVPVEKRTIHVTEVESYEKKKQFIIDNLNGINNMGKCEHCGLSISALFD